MGRITDYDKLDKLNKDDAIVVETTNGTKHITRETLDSEYAFSPGKNIEIIDKEISVKASSLLSENDDGPISSKAVFESLNQKQNILIAGNGIKIKDDTISVSDAKKYGVCYDFNSKNPKLTRLGDAKYLKAGIANGVEDTNVINDFDNIYPWSQIKRCTIANDGTITSYEGDPNYIEDGSIGEVMTEIPEHYRMTYISEETGKMYHYISCEKLNEYYKFVPTTYIGSFLMTDDSTKGVGESRSGGYYPGKYSYMNARNVATARGTNWHSMDIWDYETIKTLFIIEFATIDSQSVFSGNDFGIPFDVDIFPDEYTMKDVLDPEGEVQFDEEYQTDSIVCGESVFIVGDEVQIETSSKMNSDWREYEKDNMLYAIRKIIGIESIDEEIATNYYPDAQVYRLDSPVRIEKSTYCIRNTLRNGMTNDIKASSGKLLSYENGDGELPSEGMYVWRGIENFVGAGYVWLDGILLRDNKYWVCNEPSKYANTIYAYDTNGNITEEYQYMPISFEYPSKQGFINKMGYDEETGLTLPIETTGSSDTGYCDNFATPRNNTGMHSVRFGGSSGVLTGLFNMYCMFNVTDVNTYYARLSYCRY